VIFAIRFMPHFDDVVAALAADQIEVDGARVLLGADFLRREEAGDSAESNSRLCHGDDLGPSMRRPIPVKSVLLFP
jgi:hypothetical protein